VRQIFPVAGPEFDVVSSVTEGALPAGISRLADLYGNGASRGTAARPWVRANMIASADGASSLDGRSGGLGGPADRMLFSVLRSLADVILVGAGTARAERYKPVPPSAVWSALRAGRPTTPPIAVVSASLNLGASTRLLTDAPSHAQTIVVTSATALAKRGAELPRQARAVAAGTDEVDIGSAVAALAALGYRRILAEGGPHLLGQLADASLLDELCLTTSPVVAAGTAGRIVVGSGDAGSGTERRDTASRDTASRDSAARDTAARWTLEHVLTDAGFLFSRYVRPAD
jgi:riboflavin biosynthesis pyrimidine reductase